MARIRAVLFVFRTSALFEWQPFGYYRIGKFGASCSKTRRRLLVWMFALPKENLTRENLPRENLTRENLPRENQRKEEKNPSQQFQQKSSQNNGFSNKYLPFEEIIETSSVISVHCPLLPETKGLIGRKELKKMRKDCLLINSSRGGIVNEADLVEAIKEKRIAGAGIDVVSSEPPSLSHPYHSILNYPNFILTPHSAWIGLSTIKRAWNQVLENIENFKKGKPSRVVS